MTNTNYLPGSPRIVTTESGLQVLAFPDGTILPRCTKTTVQQGTLEARKGTAIISIGLIVQLPSIVFNSVDGHDFIVFDPHDRTLSFRDQRMKINKYVIRQTDGAFNHETEELHLLEFTIEAYLDPTR